MRNKPPMCLSKLIEIRVRCVEANKFRRTTSRKMPNHRKQIDICFSASFVAKSMVMIYVSAACNVVTIYYRRSVWKLSSCQHEQIMCGNHDNSKLTAYYLFSFKIFSRCERVHLRMHLFSVLPELEHVHKLTLKTEDPKNLKEKQK